MVHYEELLKVAPYLALPGEKIRRDKNRIFLFKEFAAWAQDNFGHLHYRGSQNSYTPRAFIEARYNFYIIARYIAEGERVFRVEPGLAQLLRDTELPEIKGEELQLPFPALFLEFPGRLFLTPHLLTPTPVIGCYIIDLRPLKEEIEIHFVKAPDKKYAPGADEFGLKINVTAKTGERVDYGDIFQKFIRSVSVREEELNELQKEFLRTLAAFGAEMTIFAINAILYATSASPDLVELVAGVRPMPKKVKKRMKAKNPNEAPPAFPRTKKTILGGSIKVQYGAPRATESSQEAKVHRKILKRFRVRGHWKWQSYAPGRSMRKHIFIAPYWRGPKDLAELLSRKYRVT
jgi:hypothetical protein